MIQLQGISGGESCGWAGEFPVFRAANLDEIIHVLTGFVRDSTPEQIKAWRASVAPLQAQCGQVLETRTSAQRYCTILEYRMPDGAKRVDAVLLLAGAVLVQDAITEFAAQGLELDHTLLIWGTDFVLKEGRWDNSAAKQYQKSSGVQDALQLRRNAYRVLLTRGREGAILCLPECMRELDETYQFLAAAGCEEMG